MKKRILKKTMKGLDGIKKELEIKTNYVSNFDFETFEIKEVEKEFLIEKEKLLIETGKKYNDNLFLICKTLFEVSEKLKNHRYGTFMKWYENINLNKDKVSELLKRYSLYEERKDLIPYISGLSGLAIRILTHKNVTLEMRQKIFENKCTSSNEIKEILFTEEKLKEKSKVVVPFYKSIFSYEKKLDKLSTKEAKEALTEIEEAELQLQKLKKLLQEKI